MKKTEQKKELKLELNLETLRNLRPEELAKVAGGYYPTETDVAGGCYVTFDGCTTGWSIGWC